jgi:hypothetical protein
MGRPTFLGMWRDLADAGQGIGPVLLSAATAAAGLGSGIIVSGVVGFAAAAALWVWIPKRPLSDNRKPRRRTGPHDSPTQAEAYSPAYAAGKQAVDAAHLCEPG